MKNSTYIIICLLLISTLLQSQSIKREFRAIWIASVSNIDWPSAPELSTTKQKEEAIKILDFYKIKNINAIILQIRPTADAMYSSELEPWSVYLTGSQGKAPDPYYDPLRFWIEEAHKRAIEVHAWFNPYRITQSLSDTLVSNHIINKNPNWGWEYGNRKYFEPGNPEVWHFVTDVVTDVVRRYDIDAVHFDDYFYPYKIKDQEIPDEDAFKKYGEMYYPTKKDEWRRHNTDTIIQILSLAIKNTKPWVKFGISPFGVWRNRSDDEMGSETKAGTTNYDALYADVLKWQKNGWIDYLMPQLYWRDNHPAADFSTLAYWWADYSYNRGLYIGLAPYRINKKSEHKLWKKDKYFIQQIEILRSLETIDGFGFFSSNTLFKPELNGLNKKLTKDICANITIVPSMPWIDNLAPNCPVNLARNRNKITWESGASKNEFDKNRFYVLYKYEADETRYLKTAAKAIAFTGELSFTFPDGIPKGIYRVSSLDRLNNESTLSKPFEIK